MFMNNFSPWCFKMDCISVVRSSLKLGSSANIAIHLKQYCSVYLCDLRLKRVEIFCVSLASVGCCFHLSHHGWYTQSP